MKENVPRWSTQYKGLKRNQGILLRKTLSKLENLIFLFFGAINDCMKALTLSALVRSVIQVVNIIITERQMSCSPGGKGKL